jgi:hypothetical protein
VFENGRLPNYLGPSSEEVIAELEIPKILSENPFEKTLICSYPRSGNTFVRKLMEEITGILTGSDCSPKQKLNKDLKEMGLLAEGIVDE